MVRPSIPSLAGDDAVVSMYAAAAIAPGSDVLVQVAEVSEIAPWRGQQRYDLTIAGRSDLMASEALQLTTTIYGSERRYAIVRSRDGLHASVAEPFIAPPELTTAQPSVARTLTWDADDTTWTFLSARDEATYQWLVTVLPGISSLDLPALLAIVPSSELGARDLQAVLSSCDAELMSANCDRSAGSARFTLAATEK